MTLVLAGHAFELEEDLWGDTPAEDRAYVEVGVFVLCDSAISTLDGRQTLDDDFQKIRRIQVMVREPQFYPDGHFNRYGPATIAGSVDVAFAGSALSAQAVFERAAAMLSDLRVSCDRSSLDGSLLYVLRSADERNPLTEGGAVRTWGDDTFTPADMAAISIQGAVADCLKRAIEDTFAAKRRICTSIEQFRSWRAEFVSASWCRRASTARLNLYRLAEAQDADGLLYFAVGQQEIPAGDLAVLGMRNEFEASAQACFNRAREGRTATIDAMREFMTRSIEQHRITGSREIGLPVREVRIPV
ncbi:hypothetical protein FHG66_05925 [Rubellimicrobium rubrum]|uniref:Uncharacterized protein n=1 Tax=Rubellimicrobium rubrum TaxID=2585369 RepID=A0A5C4N2D9_9RHOB|nr:hypothetical protein [Rubellimicrobium rubrum]TNC51091.1 hypothetical protein FHG66_05925 [Rubellimicrobium rubrum]